MYPNVSSLSCACDQVCGVQWEAGHIWVGVPQAVYVLAMNALRLGCHPEYLWLLKEGQLSAQVPMEWNVDGD